MAARQTGAALSDISLRTRAWKKAVGSLPAAQGGDAPQPSVRRWIVRGKIVAALLRWKEQVAAHGQVGDGRPVPNDEWAFGHFLIDGPEEIVDPAPQVELHARIRIRREGASYR